MFTTAHVAVSIAPATPATSATIRHFSSLPWVCSLPQPLSSSLRCDPSVLPSPSNSAPALPGPALCPTKGVDVDEMEVDGDDWEFGQLDEETNEMEQKGNEGGEVEIVQMGSRRGKRSGVRKKHNDKKN